MGFVLLLDRQARARPERLAPRASRPGLELCAPDEAALRAPF